MLPPIASFSLGALHAAYIDLEGTLWTFPCHPTLNCNAHHQLGHDHSGRGKPQPCVGSFTSVSCGAFFSLVVDLDDRIWTLGDHPTRPPRSPLRVILPFIKGPFRFVEAGGDFAVVVDSKGAVWTLGNNSQGQLGRGKWPKTKKFERVMLPPIAKISVGFAHTLAIDEAGQLWAWGRGTHGQLAEYEKHHEPRVFTEKVPKRFTKGKSPAATMNRFFPVRVAAFPNVTSVFAGCQFSVVTDTSEKVWGFGKNSNGELGLGHKLPLTGPVCLGSQNEWSNYYLSVIAAPRIADILDHVAPPGETFATALEQGRVPLGRWSQMSQRAAAECAMLGGRPEEQQLINANALLKERVVLREASEKVFMEAQRAEEESIAQVRDLDEKSRLWQCRQAYLAIHQPVLQQAAQLEQQELKRLSAALSPFDSKTANLQDLLSFFRFAGVTEAAEAIARAPQPFQMETIAYLGERTWLALGVSNLICRKQAMDALSRLLSGAFFDEEHIENCPVCNAGTVEEGVDLLDEYGVKEEEVKSKVLCLGIKVCTLLHFSEEDLETALAVSPMSADKVKVILKILKKRHHQVASIKEK